MAELLTGTKRAIEAMTKAGFKRNEFSAKTPYSKKIGGWDETSIHIRMYGIDNEERKSIMEERIPALLENGIDVIRFVSVNYNHYLLSLAGYGKKGKLEDYNGR